MLPGIFSHSLGQAVFKWWLPTKLFFIGLMDVSDDRCPDNPEDSGGV